MLVSSLQDASPAFAYNVQVNAPKLQSYKRFQNMQRAIITLHPAEWSWRGVVREACRPNRHREMRISFEILITRLEMERSLGRVDVYARIRRRWSIIIKVSLCNRRTVLRIQ
jgi:hypothetical protein